MMVALSLSAEGMLAYRGWCLLSLSSQNACPSSCESHLSTEGSVSPVSGKPFAGGDYISSIISYKCLVILAPDYPSPATRGQAEMCLIGEEKKRGGRKAKQRQDKSRLWLVPSGK